MIKNKKVAIFVDGVFIPSYAGAPNRFQYLSRALQEHTNTEVIILMCDRGWSEPELIKLEKFKTFLIHPKNFKDVTYISKIIRAENVNIIQFANLEHAIELGIPLSSLTNTYLVFESHYEDYEFARAIGCGGRVLKNIKYLQNKFGDKFDKVIALSDSDYGEENSLNIHKEEIEIIPSGINTAEFPKNCYNFRSKKILFIGNLYFDVNLVALINLKKKIYSQLVWGGYTFCVVGDISEKNKKELDDINFSILGKTANLYKVFKNSTFGLAPVINGSGIRIKILNYLNAGIPVITTNEGARGFPRKDLLIIEDDIVSYSNLINLLMGQPEKLEKISFEGREFVQREFSWEKIAEKVDKCYERILKRAILKKIEVLDEIKKITFHEQPWIREIIDGKRFKRNKPYVGMNKILIFRKT